MRHRHKMSRRNSRRSFSKGANLLHKKNMLQGGGLSMRGGIRL